MDSNGSVTDRLLITHLLESTIWVGSKQTTYESMQRPETRTRKTENAHWAVAKCAYFYKWLFFLICNRHRDERWTTIANGWNLLIYLLRGRYECYLWCCAVKLSLVDWAEKWYIMVAPNASNSSHYSNLWKVTYPCRALSPILPQSWTAMAWFIHWEDMSWTLYSPGWISSIACRWLSQNKRDREWETERRCCHLSLHHARVLAGQIRNRR